MRTFWLVGTAVALAIAIATYTSNKQLWAESETTAPRLAQEVGESLMQQKLAHAQQLLSALSIGDFEEMRVHARELQRISFEARWSQPHSPAYAEYGDDFRSALERVVASAEKQNIDGAALNYVQVVLTCVQCHKVVREGEQTAHAADMGDFVLLGKSPDVSGE